MAVPIRVRVGELALDGSLDDSEYGRALAQALPLRQPFTVWGDELHFPVPLRQPDARPARRDVAIGDLGYWPAGSMLCIFFGPTPMSAGEQPRAAHGVDVVGSLQGAEALRDAKEAELIVIECRDEAGPEAPSGPHGSTGSVPSARAR